MQMLANGLRSFEHQGVKFWDIEALTESGPRWNFLVDTIAERYINAEIDFVVCLDARGFILGGALARALGAHVGLKLIRKAGKLPGPVHAVEYGLEYREHDVIEIQDSEALRGKRVLIVDDVLATGGTASASVDLVRRSGGEVVGLAFAIELPFLEGRSKLLNYMVTSEISIIDEVPRADVEYCVDMLAEDLCTGELVVIERLTDPRGLAMPGGRIENESVMMAIQRELIEEISCFSVETRYVTTLANTSRDPRGIKVSIVVRCSVDSTHARGETRKTRVVKIQPENGLPRCNQFVLGHGAVIEKHLSL